MLNLLLTSIMIAALCGMVVCNRKHKKGTHYQLIALGLLVVVIVSGGMFMCRLDDMGFFGMENTYELRAAKDQKYVESQAHVIASYIKSSRPGNKKILLIVDKSNLSLSGFLTSKLNDMKINNVVKETLVHAPENDDKMISDSGLAAAEAASIEQAWNKHPDASKVVIAGFSPSARSLEAVENFKTLTRGKVQVILVAAGWITPWMYKNIEEEAVEAVIIVDASLPMSNELPENLTDIFRSRYVLINKSNLERNKRFLHDSGNGQ